MTPRLLTQNGWKPIAQRSQVRDNGLIRALLTYERLAENKLEERVEALEEVKKLATDLSKVREVAAKEEAKDYLEDVAKAAEDAKKPMVALVAKAQAAEKEKPDVAKIKALLTELRDAAKPPRASTPGSGAGKGAEDMPCYAQKQRADVAFIAIEYAIAKLLNPSTGWRAFLNGFALVFGTDVLIDNFLKAEKAWEDCLRANHLDLASEMARRREQVRQMRERLQREYREVESWLERFPDSIMTDRHI